MSRMRIWTMACFAFATALAFGSGPKGPPDAAPWQKFLTRYVDISANDGIHRVHYGAVTQADKASLQAYLRTVQAAPVSAFSMDDQRAFWINLYNARTVALILEHYPVKTIRDIQPMGNATAGPWDAKLLKVEGKNLSLNDVENGILRAKWKDNRIHFALNCASLGCPSLANRAFTAANAESLLEAGARDFIRSRRAADFVDGKLRLSSIFEWYRADFGGSEKAVLAFIARYSSAASAEKLRAWKGPIVYDYDWNLNDAEPLR